MKKLLFIFTACLAISTLKAQSNQEEIDFYQSIFGMEKKAAVMEFVQPSEAQSADFWALYDEYETERKALGKKRIDLLYKYAAQYNNMSDDTADSLMKEMISLGKKTDKLLEKYYKKIKKKTSPIVAAQFYQIEAYILSAIRTNILAEIPFVESPNN